MNRVQEAFLENLERELSKGTYERACQNVVKKLEQINESISVQYDWRFIKDISYRVKSPVSCMEKMMSKGHSLKVENAMEKLSDIAGVRAVCYFIDDIYYLANLLSERPNYEFVKLKDYVRKPKQSGYQSLHLILRVPVEEADGTRMVKVEVQLRTRAMDFWSEIEHYFVYKSKDMRRTRAKNDIYEEEFLKCSKSIQKIDKQMLKIRKKIETR